MKLEIIRNLSALLEIETEWMSFACSVPNVTPFQIPAWLLTWWRHFGNGELRVLVFRERGNVAGVVPCFVHEWNGALQMTLIGSGISDYLDPVIRPDCGHEVVDGLRAFLESALDWQVCNWQDLSFNTPLRQLGNPSLETAVIEETECRVLLLSGKFEQYWKTRPGSLRKNIRRDREKTESVAKIRFDVTSQADAELMSGLIRLHGARWQAHGQTGMIAANGSADFLLEIASRFAEHDLLRIFSLHVGEDIGALILGLSYSEKMFVYLTAFDPQYEHLGIGRTLLFEAVRYCFENGYSEWDFLRGDEPYKSWWGAETIRKCRLLIRRR